MFVLRYHFTVESYEATFPRKLGGPLFPERKLSMKMIGHLVFGFLILMIITQGCASRASYQFANESRRPSDYKRFFDELDSAVYRSGTRNGAYFSVPGFPYLRADRFLVSLKDRLKSDAQRQQWVRLMQQLDLSARKTEIQTLPAGEV